VSGSTVDIDRRLVGSLFIPMALIAVAACGAAPTAGASTPTRAVSTWTSAAGRASSTTTTQLAVPPTTAVTPPPCGVTAATPGSPLASGWRSLRTSDGAGTIAVPPTWHQYPAGPDPTDAIATAEQRAFPRLYDQNPDFFVADISFAPSAQASPTKLLAADISAAPVTHHLSTLVTLVADDFPGNTCGQAEQDLLAELTSIARAGSFVQEQAPIGSATMLEATLTLNADNASSSTGPVEAAVVYDIPQSTANGERNWVVTFVTTPDQVAGDLPTFRAIAQSLRPAP
jgi:hypothetical protein